MISIKNSTIGFNKELFTIPSLELEKGKLFTLIGKNGAGKSTFFQTLLKQVPLLSGELKLEEKNLNKLSIKNLATYISFVTSKFDGVQHLSVYDYIALGRSPYTNLIGKLSPNDHQIIVTTIEKLGIMHLKHKDTMKISDGERQICSIAKALVQQTPIILLDEPSAFLDYSNRINILQILKNLAREENLCIIQSSHDLELSLEYTDEFLVITQEKKEMLVIKNDRLHKENLILSAFG